jgi:hypothetical protein
MRETDTHLVDAFYYRLAFWLSAAYFAVVLITLIGVNLNNEPNYELLSQSNYWLGTMQGFVTGAIGLFFVKKKEPEEKTKPLETAPGSPIRTAGE